MFRILKVVLAVMLFVLLFVVLGLIVSRAQGPTITTVDYGEMGIKLDSISGTVRITNVPGAFVLTADSTHTIITGTVVMTVAATTIAPPCWGDDEGWSSIFDRTEVRPIEGEVVVFLENAGGGNTSADWRAVSCLRHKVFLPVVFR